MVFFSKSRGFLGAIILFVFILGCATAGVRDAEGPTIKEAQEASPKGPKARIAVARFVNNTGGFEGQMRRQALEMQAKMANTMSIMGSPEMAEYQEKLMEYVEASQEYQAKVDKVGKQKAGPPPKMPKPPKMTKSTSPYMTPVTDPVAGGIRDMMIRALFNSGRFIVLERSEINTINWEQEFSKTESVGNKAAIPSGQIEGAEIIVIGSVNTIEAKQSGGNIGGIASIAAAAAGAVWDMPYLEGVSDVNLSWENARTAMEIRGVDTRTSRIIAAFGVEGKATSGSAGAAYSNNAGDLAAGLSVYSNTPIEEAFRKMIDAAVKNILTKTPESYYHVE
jgi:curli biogenesis system outer membrane secretion channel CsgG